MKRIGKAAAVAAIALLLATCATSALLEFDEGEPQLADGPTLALEWDQNAATAQIEVGAVMGERTALEIRQPYGNSFMVWHFTGLAPSAPVAVTLDLWVDAFFNDTWVELLWAPGLIPATAAGLEAIRTNPEKEDGYFYRWDSNGDDMGTSTDGWVSLRNSDQVADEEGNFTVGLWVGHWSNNPVSVSLYLDNLSVASRTGR